MGPGAGDALEQPAVAASQGDGARHGRFMGRGGERLGARVGKLAP